MGKNLHFQVKTFTS